jgi:hypothetical protein
MTPEELRSFMTDCELEPSAIGFNLGIDHHRIRKFIDGEVNALTQEERESLGDRLVCPEEERGANWNEQSALVDAVGEFMASHGVRYDYEEDGGRKTASGTLVQIGERILVATTRHTIRKGTQFLEFTGGNTSRFEQTIDHTTGQSSWSGPEELKVVNHSKHTTLDVGFLELESTALSVLKRKAISLSNISVRLPQYGRIAYVFGYPFEMERRVPVSATSGAILIPSLTYPNPLLAPEEWPEVPAADRQPEEQVDCFLRYARDEAGKLVVPMSGTILPEVLDFSNRLPAVHGMSGGGFWQSWNPSGRDTLWFPSSYELFAIQSTWNEKEQYIRGIQVRHWLDLVAGAYPDLLSEISSHTHFNLK